MYAPDAVVHTEGRSVQGRAHLQGWLEASPLLSLGRDPVVRGENGNVLLRWPDRAASESAMDVRCRVAHGLIAEQWVGEAPPPNAVDVAVTTAAGPATMSIVSRGEVAEDARAYALQQLGAVIADIEERVLYARVKLTQAADPARERPALAQVSVDIDGDLVRAQLAGHEMREAIDLLRSRLRGKLEHRAQHRQALRKRPGTSRPGRWRHGDPRTERPDYFDRPADERELIRHETYVDEELTPDEAAFDLEQRDFDFYLFRDLASGEDALLERAAAGSYRLTRVHPAAVDAGATAVALEVAEHAPPALALEEAIERIAVGGEPHLFFVDAATGRGSVIYRRYDGHYGLIAPE
jgi:hypothetical protein